jgi:EmrB/QacA subfamily drug resistance transporter
MRARLRDPEFAERVRWFTLLVLCVSLIVIVLDNTILNVALPTLARPVEEGGLGATTSQLQWIVDSYVIVFAGLLLSAGSLGDRFGRYKALTFGLAVFGTGSLLSAFAGSASTLIATRSLMGVGGAFIMPSTLSIITNVFTKPLERGKAIGVWAGVSAIGIGIGPITGGILLEHFWWGSIFLVNVPIVIAGLVAGYFLVPESKDPSAPRLDPVGAGLSIAGITSLLWGVIEAPSHGWTSPEILSAFAIGAVILIVFFVWELHTPSPMLDMHFFENPRFSAASGAITITFFAMFGSLFLLTQYLQLVLGFSTVEAGAVLLPQAATIMIAAPLSSGWVRRWGNKRVVVTGLLTVALSFLLIHSLDVNSSALQVIAVTMVMGLGMGNVMAPCTDSIMGSLPRAKAGVGSAVNDTTRQFGGAVGVAVFGSLVASRFADQMGTRLSGTVPAAVLGQARESIGSAFEAVRNAPSGNLFADQIIGAARISFVDAMHTAMLLAMCMLLVAAAIVAKFLPARARDDDLGPAAVEAAPVGAGPVDVIPAGLAPDLADITDSP